MRHLLRTLFKGPSHSHVAHHSENTTTVTCFNYVLHARGLCPDIEANLTRSAGAQPIMKWV